jgi:protein-disulfide isomerase
VNRIHKPTLWALGVAATTLIIGLWSTGCATGPDTAPNDSDQDRSTEEHASSADQLDSDRLPVGKSPVVGDRRNPLTVTLFVDPLDPEVSSLLRRLETARREFTSGSFRVVFHMTPEQFRPGAGYVAYALMAAHRHGEFLSLFHRIVDRQPQLSRCKSSTEIRTIVDPLLRRLGVSPPEGDWADDILHAIDEDAKLAERLEIDRTPSIFLNGKRIDTDVRGEEFAGVLEEVDDELYRLRVTQGLSRTEVYRASVNERYSPPHHASSERHVRYVEVRDGDPVVGEQAHPTVTMVAFVSYNSPLTTGFWGMASSLLERFDDTLRLVVKPVPKRVGQPVAARTALAAERIGAFEPVHEALLQTNRPLGSVDEAEALVESTGTDVGAWHDAYASEQLGHHLRIIAGDIDEYDRLPAMYVNGIEFERVPSYNAMVKFIDAQSRLDIHPRVRRDDISLYRAAVRTNAETHNDQ